MEGKIPVEVFAKKASAELARKKGPVEQSELR
jgi:hypothetical protein